MQETIQMSFIIYTKRHNQLSLLLILYIQRYHCQKLNYYYTWTHSAKLRCGWHTSKKTKTKQNKTNKIALKKFNIHCISNINQKQKKQKNSSNQYTIMLILFVVPQQQRQMQWYLSRYFLIYTVSPNSDHPQSPWC